LLAFLGVLALFCGVGCALLGSDRVQIASPSSETASLVVIHDGYGAGGITEIVEIDGHAKADLPRHRG